eukprot:COSAG02_NODE_16192_length_1105_cov_10.862823_2_plen_153_part_00
MTKNIVSRDQDAIRPLEEISNGKISRTECDKRVAAHTVPGTPCLVQLPHGPKASSITNYSRSRNGIAVDMLGNLTIFEDPEDPSIHFKSRGFTILKMLGHRDAWDLFKAKSAWRWASIGSRLDADSCWSGSTKETYTNATRPAWFAKVTAAT